MSLVGVSVAGVAPPLSSSEGHHVEDGGNRTDPRPLTCLVKVAKGGQVKVVYDIWCISILLVGLRTLLVYMLSHRCELTVID